MTAKDIIPGRCYQAKRPKPADWPPRYNDRQVKWVNSQLTEVQYDSPTIKDGKRYPKVSMEKFLEWVGADVTDIMPEGDWRPYEK